MSTTEMWVTNLEPINTFFERLFSKINLVFNSMTRIGMQKMVLSYTFFIFKPWKIPLFLSSKYKTLGASINYLNKQGGGRSWSPKCQRYYISLFSKLFNEGGEEGSKILKFLSTQFMDAPFMELDGNTSNVALYQLHTCHLTDVYC